MYYICTIYNMQEIIFCLYCTVVNMVNTAILMQNVGYFH